MIWMLGCLTLSQRSLRLFSFLLILFSFFLSASFISTILSSTSFYLLLQLFYYWFPPECFWSQLLHCSLLIDSFISSRSLLNFPCIFSNLVSRLFICNSILFSRFWIIFAIFILNYFSGRLPIASFFVWFGGILSCSFTCCLFILFRLLCLGWPSCILEVCGSSLLWRFLTVGGVGQVACQGFLVREACLGVLVGGAGSLLSGVQWSVQ